jgi:hypothetical protein
MSECFKVDRRAFFENAALTVAQAFAQAMIDVARD